MQSDHDQAQRKLGKGFWIGAWICVLILLVMFFDDKLQQQYNPNQNVDYQNEGGVATVVLKRNRAGHYLTGGFINGQPVTFLLDTGATHVAIPQQVADKIGLERGSRHDVNTANGLSFGYRTQIDSLEIGAINLTQVSASIVPNFSGEEILLGMSALKQVEFTQRGSTLTIKYY